MRGACCSGSSYPLPEFDATELLENAGKLMRMSTPTIYLKNTVSGVVSEFDRATAERYLEHPDYAKFLVVVDSPKSEVLAQPYTVDADGERVLVEDEKPAEITAPSAPKVKG